MSTNQNERSVLGVREGGKYPRLEAPAQTTLILHYEPASPGHPISAGFPPPFKLHNQR